MMINKAVVIGGSNGIGLAIARKLLNDGCGVKILDISQPDKNIIMPSECEYSYCDLRYLNEAQIEELARDENINALVITAGIGRIAEFRYFHTAEIEKTFAIDTVSTIKILKIFYDRLLTRGGVMVFTVLLWVLYPAFCVRLWQQYIHRPKLLCAAS